jgi:hypothetical protein
MIGWRVPGAGVSIYLHALFFGYPLAFFYSYCPFAGNVPHASQLLQARLGG